MNVLALCGSLRRQSLSAALLRAACTLAPPPMRITLFERLGALPLFNPDDEADPAPAVRRLWDAVTRCDGILIASPEYAHGVTGSLKNALDWLVGHIPFAGTPVAVLNPSWQSYHADEALKETLRTMAADLVVAACRRVPVVGAGLDQRGIETSPAHAPEIRAALEHLARRIAERGTDVAG